MRLLRGLLLLASLTAACKRGNLAGFQGSQNGQLSSEKGSSTSPTAASAT